LPIWWAHAVFSSKGDLKSLLKTASWLLARDLIGEPRWRCLNVFAWLQTPNPRHIKPNLRLTVLFAVLAKKTYGETKWVLMSFLS
jgi:hypothetical protein